MQLERAQSRIRRDHAPCFAYQLLEINSLRAQIAYGLPSLGREIGRGRFGVVYRCASWGQHQNLAVKCVLPPEDRHWRDIALEIYYCRCDFILG